MKAEAAGDRAVHTSQGYLQGVAGVRLLYQAWESRMPSAALLVVHGLGEHSGRYASLANHVARLGLNVYSFDQRGHGRSDGRRGHVRNFHRYLEDLERFRRTVSIDLPPNLPIYLLGHSLGGLIVLRYLQEFRSDAITGAILSSPFLSQPDVPAWKAAMGRVLSRLVPVVPLPNEIDSADISSDPDVVEAYRSDPLVHDRITPRLFTEILRALNAVHAGRETLTCPLLFLISSGDRIARADETLAFAHSLGSLATTEVYDGCGHELLHDRKRTEVIAALVGWIARNQAADLPK